MAKLLRSSGVRLATLALSISGCTSDFDTSREAVRHGSVGRELYAVLCDRVGAQALREDFTAASYRALCRPLRWEGDTPVYADGVDREKLPALRDAALDTQGKPVSIVQQQAYREYAIARIETLARERERVTRAIDSAIPDVSIPAYSASAATCDMAQMDLVRLHDALPDALGRLSELGLHSDVLLDNARGMGELAQFVAQDEDSQQAIARIRARVGYAPAELALGLVRPLLSYPRLMPLGQAVLPILGSGSEARARFDLTRAAGAGELVDDAAASDTADPLTTQNDDALDLDRLSRPRTDAELLRSVLWLEDPAFAAGTSMLMVERDARGVAKVALREGHVPAPFVEGPDHLAEVDELGRFVAALLDPVPLPFAQPERSDPATRDAQGRALGADGVPLYAYRDAATTFVNPLARALRSLLSTEEGPESPLFAALSALPVVVGGAGARVPSSFAAPDGTSREFPAFDADASPALDLTYAAAQTLALPEADVVAQLTQKVLEEQPALFAEALSLALDLDAIADRHPEAFLPDSSLFWDDAIALGVKVGRVPGLLEDLARSLAVQDPAPLARALASLLTHKDRYQYARDPAKPDNYELLNGPPANVAGGIDVPPSHEVDRNRPDTGENRSMMQESMHLVHDALGLQLCTKDNAIAHLDMEFPPGSGVRVKFDYPVDPMSGTVCAFFGSAAPPKLERCGLMHMDVSAELVNTFLGKAHVDVTDPCIEAIITSPLSSLGGDGDALMESISGVRGFGANPTPQGIARITFFDAGYAQFGGAQSDMLYPLTGQFVSGLFEPVETAVCPLTPVDSKALGKSIGTRTCARFADTMRGRHPGGMFLLEALPFYDAIRPAARAFDAHDADALMIEMLELAHLHWGTLAQSHDECDPSLPRSDARFCYGSGLSRYEPMIADFMTDAHAIERAAKLVSAFDAIKLSVCTHSTASGCDQRTERTGLEIMSTALRAFLDPQQNTDLKDRRGAHTALRNDGSELPQVTPVYLWTEALRSVDAAHAGYAGEQSLGRARQDAWRWGRSHLIDTLFSVEHGPDGAFLTNRSIARALPVLLRTLRSQTRAYCPEHDLGRRCRWAQTTLPARASELLRHPLTAGLIDTFDALRNDADASRELSAWLAFMLDDATEVRGLSALASALFELLADTPSDPAKKPLLRLMARAMWPGGDASKDAVSSSLDVLSYVVAPAAGSCASYVDPQYAFQEVARRAVLPMSELERTPFEELLDVLLAVNRVQPGKQGDLDPDDYANVAREMSLLFLDESSGLEQVYTLLKSLSQDP